MFILLTMSSFGNECIVKLRSISEKYEGGCKKGLAHGSGKAWGLTDFYEGQFKKGYPHGFGTYKWGNGTIYIGNFSKGLMNGEGELKIVASNGKVEVKKGFFENGKFIGLYKQPYKIISKLGIRAIKFQENSIDKNEVKINIYSKGVKITPPISIKDTNNTIVENRNGAVMVNPLFPLKRVEVSFTVNSFPIKAIFEIYKEGNWEVIISL